MQESGFATLEQLEAALSIVRIDFETAGASHKADVANYKAQLAHQNAVVGALMGNLARLNGWRDQQLRRAAGQAGLELSDGFNGQVSKAEVFQELVIPGARRLALQTGAFHGRTTRYLAGRFGHVIALEDDENYIAMAKEHCQVHSNISFAHGDSRKLVEIWNDIDASKELIDFAYLDARASRICSLPRELEFVLGHAQNAIIFIDDFKVVDDPDYGFEDYPSGEQMDMPLIRHLLQEYNPLCFYPARRGIDDTSLYYADRSPAGMLVLIPPARAAAAEGAKSIRPALL